jgi:hypothetical protein
MSAYKIVIALVMISGIALAAEQPSSSPTRPTLVDRAREHGGINAAGEGCGWFGGPPTLESLLKDADVVVHGIVVEVAGRLSEDGQHVWTDYAVQPINIVLDRTKDSVVTRSSDAPVFTSRGGTIIVEGLTISETIKENGSYVRLSVGDEIVAFGKAREGRFDLNTFGMFPVVAGRVRPNGRWPKLTSEGGSMDLAAFVARVRQTTLR